MDPAAEALMRSALHDLANVLSGVRGILELSDPTRPLSSRDQDRLDAVITDGMNTLERARHLAMGTLPESMVEGGLDWRHQLGQQLRTLGTLFRCQFQVTYTGEDAQDRWPGELLRSYAAALTRQVLPYVPGGALTIACHADAREWHLRWEGCDTIPECLRPELETRPRDIGARWALRVGSALGATLAVEQGGLVVRVPRF